MLEITVEVPPIEDAVKVESGFETELRLNRYSVFESQREKEEIASSINPAGLGSFEQELMSPENSVIVNIKVGLFFMGLIPLSAPQIFQRFFRLIRWLLLSRCSFFPFPKR